MRKRCSYLCNFVMLARTFGESISVFICQQALKEVADIDWQYACLFSVLLTERALSSDPNVCAPLIPILHEDGFDFDDNAIFLNIERVYDQTVFRSVYWEFDNFLNLLLASKVLFCTVEGFDINNEVLVQYHVFRYKCDDLCEKLITCVPSEIPKDIVLLIVRFVTWDVKALDKDVQKWIQVCNSEKIPVVYFRGRFSKFQYFKSKFQEIFLKLQETFTKITQTFSKYL